MKRRLAALALAALILGPAPQGQARQVLDMQGVDIRAFVQDVGRATGVTYILDPRVQGSVTVTSTRQLSRPQLQEVLFSTLRANGLIAVPDGPNTFRVVPDDAAASLPPPAAGSGFSTRVIGLSTLDAADAAQVLRPLVGRSGSAQAAPGNVLIIADYADNLARIAAIIDQIDKDRSVTRSLTVHNGGARELIEAVRPLVVGDPQKPRVVMTAVESSNAILMRGDAGAVDQAQRLIEDLDQRAASNDDIRVVRLDYADASDLVGVLRGLVGQPVDPVPGAPRAGAAAPAPVAAATTGGRRASISEFAGANALIISADPETQRILAQVIRQLDVRREQVLVEGIVVEVSDGLAQRLGLQWAAGGKAGGFVTNFPAGSPGLLGLATAAVGQGGSSGAATLDTLRAGAVADLTQTPGLLGGGAAQAGDLTFGALINAVKTDSDSNLLSTPSILTLDNQPAHLLVGQEVPVTTGEVLGSNNTNPFRTIERRDVGVQLEVTPQINAAGSITLHLRQEVSSVAGPATAGSAELAFNKREIDTTVLVDDGEILVLGGLLDQSDTKGVDRVPGLGSIPGIGALFSSRSQSSSKRNLMVFIRTRIIRTRTDAQAVTAQAYDTMRNAEIGSRADAKSALEEAVRDYLRATPPGSSLPRATAP